MNIDQTIQSALNEIIAAEGLIEEAGKKYCRARQVLERIHAPAHKGAIISDALQQKIKSVLAKGAKRRMKPKTF